MILGSHATSFPAIQPAARHELVWRQVDGLNIAKISGGVPRGREWRRLLDNLRPTVRPVVLWMRGRIWIGSEGRAELAAAIGSCRVALIVDDNIGRGLATALRWLDVKVDAYSMAELDQLETDLELEPGAVAGMLDRLD
ncbi:hypothetical protein ENSA5_01080 [Enhygromyxa salina]|uniref:Uncharacterized protein n=1 Tax=Enhygromyxa salina TaxID=215803 RepID=A0A2S9YL48_9BACT|nr:hypothetical protein [Enhygromyxa salina]PRQ05788.1 hypothetical protein ENSA5_01080 [Enhygromyxa salina]